ncbi:E3 SUMO-protein ligase ZBED1 [Drosophila bipectinata]|uniref:E3 SUMO-protein ligase ZBED1 n=1 Tax=Drosophila bipectinata TaxID=42026 RepID=UPI0038B3B03E
MKRTFKEIENFALTCDGVTLTNSTRAFLTVTAHFLKDNILQSICLQAVRMNESHTGEYICTLLQNTCREFGIEEFKLESLTTDNAKNMKAASNLFLGVGHHVPCFAHTINLVVDNTVKDIKSFSTVLDKVKRIVTYFKHSPAAMDVLRKLQSDEGVPEGCIRTLTQNIDTRWNSCLDMLISFTDLENTVAMALINRSKSTKILPEMLSKPELDSGDFCELLKPFKEATERVSGESYVTVSLVVPMITMSLAKLRKILVQSADGILMKDVLLKRSDEYLIGLSKNKILIKACLLDPRFKKMYIPPTMVLEASKDILEEMQLNSEGKRRSLNVKPLEELDTTQVNRQESFFEAHNRTIQQNQISDSPYEKEFHLYISLPNTNWEADPLQFWTSQQQTMPHLSKLALRYLIIPGSSASSERMASAIKCVVCYSRSRMTDRHVTQRVFLKSLAKHYWK